MDIADLVGKDLAGWHIEEVIEIYSVDEDGCYQKSFGVLADRTIAIGYAQKLGPNYHTRQMVILSNGEFAYFLDLPALLLNKRFCFREVQLAALAKLTQVERMLILRPEDDPT